MGRVCGSFNFATSLRYVNVTCSLAICVKHMGKQWDSMQMLRTGGFIRIYSDAKP